MHYCLYKIKYTFKMGVFTFLAALAGMKINVGCFISVQLQKALGLLTVEIYKCVCVCGGVRVSL